MEVLKHICGACGEHHPSILWALNPITLSAAIAFIPNPFTKKSKNKYNKKLG